MGIRFAVIAGAALLSACGLFEPRPELDSAALLEQLVPLEQQSWVAWKKRDGAFFATFLADGHVDVGSAGSFGKKDIVAFAGSPACVVASYKVDSFSAHRISDDAAVLVYHAEQDTRCNGKPVPSPVWVSSTYVLRDGRWQNAVYQQTPASR